ncbi:MAG: hypothetical protein Q9M76_05875 [Candidatus Dojkabacteria bacterium]|nr:hypothetical protein [Candidatus Dojkabacteria bacterium]
MFCVFIGSTLGIIIFPIALFYLNKEVDTLNFLEIIENKWLLLALISLVDLLSLQTVSRFRVFPREATWSELNRWQRHRIGTDPGGRFLFNYHPRIRRWMMVWALIAVLSTWAKLVLLTMLIF